MPENDLRERAKDHLPTVLLTMLSIVQALALELMWEHIHDHSYLYSLSFSSLLGWLQIGGSLFSVLLIWLVYTGLVMRFRWVPTTSDSVFPFAVGIIEFSLIAAQGPGRFGAWFLVLALLFGAMTWVSQVTFSRARLDAENQAFFANVERASWRDMLPQMSAMIGLVLIGVYLWVSENEGWAAIFAIFFALGLIGHQMWLINFYWKRSMGHPSSQ